MTPLIVNEHSTAEEMLPVEKLTYLQKELGNIRDEYAQNKYIQEALTVLNAGGLRSAIGSYWNAVIDDIRRKILQRSIDLFNKEINPPKLVKTYEDFQNHITDHDLIEGAYKIGVLSWEGRKLIQQARETRNIFDGHPDSSDPTLIKVFNLISDCNKYVLSQENPAPIIDTNNYILNMDGIAFHKNDLAIAQAFSDLPQIYKNELINKFFSLYLQDNISTILRSNIEFSLPILWNVLAKESRQQIGGRFDKEMVGGNQDRVDKAVDFMSIVDGLKYVASASRNIIFEPAIKYLEVNLDNWHTEGDAVNKLSRIGSVIPTDLIPRYVAALTLTYVGVGSYFSWAASPQVASLFKKFDRTSIEAFVNTIKTNDILRNRISNSTKLDRLRDLATILLNESTPVKDLNDYLELVVDRQRTGEFYKTLERKK